MLHTRWIKESGTHPGNLQRAASGSRIIDLVHKPLDRPYVTKSDQPFLDFIPSHVTVGTLRCLFILAELVGPRFTGLAKVDYED